MKERTRELLDDALERWLDPALRVIVALVEEIAALEGELSALRRMAAPDPETGRVLGFPALARRNAEQITTGCGFPPDPHHAEGCVEDSPQGGPMVNAAPDPEPDPRPGVAGHIEVQTRRRKTPLGHLPRSRTNGTVSDPAPELKQAESVSETETGIEAAPEPPAEPLPAGSDAPEPEGDDNAPEQSWTPIARAAVLGDVEAARAELGMPKAPWLHKWLNRVKAELIQYKPQSVVAAIQCVRDGDSDMNVRVALEPPCKPDGLNPIRAFLGAWAVHLEKQTPLQEREEKARLVAMLEGWR